MHACSQQAAHACISDDYTCRQVAGGVGEARTKGSGHLCSLPSAQVCGRATCGLRWHRQAACAGSLRHSTYCLPRMSSTPPMHARPTASRAPSAHILPPLIPCWARRKIQCRHAYGAHAGHDTKLCSINTLRIARSPFALR